MFWLRVRNKQQDQSGSRGGTTAKRWQMATGGFAPLRNLRVQRLLPEYRFRFGIVRKGSFFSILQVLAILSHRPFTQVRA
jgi:hypothetical protein